jgi:catechol 2,3-dioxygenase-like lactoylglutathione lyase family enzyme
MIDHVNLPVSDLNRSKVFYDAVLAALGVQPLVSEEDVVGYGTDHWSFGVEATEGAFAPLHLAFRAPTNAQVLAFYGAALAHGGVDNGAPGPRPEYGPSYFAAFIRDPDGHNIEAVCRS